MNDRDDKTNKTDGNCGPDCNCGTSGGNTRMKCIVSGVVVLAAIAVVVAKTSQTSQAETPKQEFATVLPVAAVTNVVKIESTVDTNIWGAPLSTMAELNKVAVDLAGVFVVVPSSDAQRTEVVQKEVLTAAGTITARGSKMGKFILSKDSPDYAVIAKQIGIPAVLAMVKGGGLSAVPDKQITQENLLKAFVGASRPSGCGPSGCGPGASECK